MSAKRAVAYIRVSTEKDSQIHSYEYQEHYWKTVFEGNPEIELVDIYADKGISGHSIEKRPRFLAMMKDAREHKFEVIYTKSVSRFARNITQLLESVRELRDIGIEVVFEKENIHTFDATSEIYLTIAATIAENDLEVDSERMRWTVRHRYENGWISIGNGLYGLKMTGYNDLEVVPEEADIVRFIFDSYVNGGLGSRKIAEALNDAGIKTRSGKPWIAKHIVDMLRNEKYKGDAMMGKKVKHLGVYHTNWDAKYAPHYYIENTHEAIIDKETWDKAQAIMNERGKNYQREKSEHTFSGLIECGCCGKPFIHKINSSGTKWKTPIWACSAYLGHGTKVCSNSRIKETVLEEQFVSAYNEFIKKRPQGDSVGAMKRELAELRLQERELAELMLQRLLPPKEYEVERSELKTHIIALKEKIMKHQSMDVPEKEHVPIAEFDAEKAKRFISKVIVDQFTVTFEFYNGARISRTYNNGTPGNKPGWNKKEAS